MWKNPFHITHVFLNVFLSIFFPFEKGRFLVPSTPTQKPKSNLLNLLSCNRYDKILRIRLLNLFSTILRSLPLNCFFGYSILAFSINFVMSLRFFFYKNVGCTQALWNMCCVLDLLGRGIYVTGFRLKFFGGKCRPESTFFFTSFCMHRKMVPQVRKDAFPCKQKAFMQMSEKFESVICLNMYVEGLCGLGYKLTIHKNVYFFWFSIVKKRFIFLSLYWTEAQINKLWIWEKWRLLQL